MVFYYHGKKFYSTGPRLNKQSHSPNVMIGVSPIQISTMVTLGLFAVSWAVLAVQGLHFMLGRESIYTIDPLEKGEGGRRALI